MKKEHILFTIIFFIVLTIVFFKIPNWVNNFREKKYNKINQNGKAIRGVVYSKSTYKGKWIKFKYFYKSKEYRNDMQNDIVYTTLSIGDTIIIIVDSLRPEDSYIKELK